MSNCIDYILEYGDKDFEESRFGEVDGVILSRLAYVPFERVGRIGAISIGEAFERMFDAGDVIDGNDFRLFELMAKSKRFRNLLLIEYESRREEESETQFSAITISLVPERYYIAYRGTDDSLVGWKEDFNMSFMTPVPSQELAVEYFERVASRVRGNFALGGHSKGGNLAVYAAAFCLPALKSRIEAVVNYDGPGFDEKVIATPGYREIMDRTVTFVPQSAVVGMLLNHEEKYIVVKSTNSGLFQHDIYSWTVEGDEFVRILEVSDASRFIDRTLKESLREISPDKREQLVELVHSAVAGTGSRTLTDLKRNLNINLLYVMKSLGTLDGETARLFLDVILALIKGAGKTVLENLTQD